MAQLLSGENPITGVRQSWSVLLPTVVAGVGSIVVIAVLAHLAPDSILGHSTATVTHWAVALVVVVALIAFLVNLAQWRMATYTLTTHRVIVSRGIVSRVTESISLDRIQDTRVRRTLAQRVIGCGDVEIESAGRDGIELLRRIPNPDSFYNSLIQAMEEYRHPGTAPTTAAPGAPSPTPSGL